MCHGNGEHNSLVYVNGSFVFRLSATDNGYDSHIQIFTRRHFDNANANGTPPWAFKEIKVRKDNGEFIVNPEYAPFVDFCEDWINNPQHAESWAKAVVGNVLDTPTHTHFHAPEEFLLNDFPYVVKKS